MFDAVEMMRKTWSGMNVPSALQPTMDIGEIDRRIADLRVVEQWLQLNQTMLQTTIQTLEIQRNTVAAFQAFTKAGAMVVNPPAPNPPASPPFNPPANPLTNQPTSPPISPPISPSANPSPNLGPAPGTPPGSSIAAAQAALWWDFLQQPFRQMTQAAQPASTTKSTHHPTGPSSANKDAELSRSATPPSSPNQAVDGGETPKNGRANSTRGSRS
jgi:hypothetical protein